jgi:hypothetical protein
MKVMFKKAPCKNKLQSIIKNATSNIYPKYQHSEIDKYVESFYRESMHALIDKASIDHYFEQIIEDIYTLSTIRCSQKTKDSYLELIAAFDVKIRIVYNIGISSNS